MVRFNNGDYVLLYDPSKRKKLVVKVRKDRKIHTQWGVIDPNKIIDNIPGSRITTHIGYQLLVFKPKLYEIIEHSNIFRYATQIVRPRDWGLIITYADIHSGSRVLEIGTGSGAFTAYLSFIVAPNGKVISYEKIPERAKIAIENLRALGVPEVYEIRIGDPAQDGIQERDFDVAFIDVPEPWTLLNVVYDAIKDGGSIVCYIPTFNQIQKTLETATKIGFSDFLIIDHFFREIQANPNAIRPLLKSYVFSAYILFARKIR